MSPEPALYVGVDAGGTRTRVLLADGAGATPIPSTAIGSGGNYQELGAEGLAEHIRTLLAQLSPPRVPDVLCAGVAGAGRAAEQAALTQRLEALGLARRCLVVSDARAALEGAHAGHPGIVCIAGTGSIVLGRNAAGLEARAGGWGPALGDEGSAYALVMAGVRAALRERDGWGAPTVLAQALLPALDLETWDGVVGGIYGGHLTRDRVAAACPAVFAAAAEGDAAARQILVEGATALGLQAAAVAARLALPRPAPVACHGGVFGQIDVLWPYLAAAAGDGVLTRQHTRLSAGHGALLLAAAADGQRFAAAVLRTWEGGQAP